MLQVVHLDTGLVATGATILPFDNTIPQNTEGDQYMSLAITPKSPNSTLVINVVAHVANDTNSLIAAALFRDSTVGAVGVGYLRIANVNFLGLISYSVKVASSSIAATTFKIRIGSDSGTNTFNGSGGVQYFGGVASSSIRITEIGP